MRQQETTTKQKLNKQFDGYLFLPPNTFHMVKHKISTFS